MLIASITEVRKRFEEFAKLVESGETIVLTRWGKPIADMRPHQKPQESIEDSKK
jgi:antitoxin (DNA-binding transcriptional repressor) of toxin-antitoxin stability system